MTYEADITSAQQRPATFGGLRDGEALAALVRRAAEVFATHAPLSFVLFSKLLDALLPTDQEDSARIARAIEMDVDALTHLRNGSLDPLRGPRSGMAALRQAFRLDAGTFRALIEADHARFSGKLVAGLALRGGRETTAQAWKALDDAYARLALDDPALEDPKSR